MCASSSSVLWNKEIMKVHRNSANNIAEWVVLGNHKWLVLWQWVLVIFITLADEVPTRNISEKQNIIRTADKSLARPGKKQVTATKIGIYSTYSPRSSIHFLAPALAFASHSKNYECCPSNLVSAVGMTLRQLTSPHSTHYRHTKHMLPHNHDGLIIHF
jgi:hypothetical protein